MSPEHRTWPTRLGRREWWVECGRVVERAVQHSSPRVEISNSSASWVWRPWEGGDSHTYINNADGEVAMLITVTISV